MRSSAEGMLDRLFGHKLDTMVDNNGGFIVGVVICLKQYYNLSKLM